MSNPICLYYPLEERHMKYANASKETKLGGLKSTDENYLESNLERYITFKCRDYKMINKGNVDGVTMDTKNLFHISLPLPANFDERISQQWNSREKIVGLGQIAGRGMDWAKDKLGVFSSWLTKATGITSNPAEEMFYSNPEFRSFNFSFEMIIRSKKEEQVVKLILLLFKRYCLPKLGFEQMWVNFPAVWELSVSGIDNTTGQNNILNFGFEKRFFAMTDYNVDYTPDGNFYALTSGFPPKVNLKMNFVETTPLYRNDKEGDNGQDVDVENVISEFLGADYDRYYRKGE
jgi:hypothetical protein